MRSLCFRYCFKPRFLPRLQLQLDIDDPFAPLTEEDVEGVSNTLDRPGNENTFFLEAPPLEKTLPILSERFRNRKSAICVIERNDGSLSGGAISFETNSPERNTPALGMGILPNSAGKWTGNASLVTTIDCCVS